MDYICELCNYVTNDKSNINRHFKSEKHLAKSTKPATKVTRSNTKSNILVTKSNNLVTQQVTQTEIPSGRIRKKMYNSGTKSNSSENGVIGGFLCEFCGGNFSHKNAVYRHMKHYCKEKKLGSNKLSSRSIESNIDNYENKLKQYETKIDMLEREKDIYKNENEYHKTLTTNAGNIVDKSLSTLAFVVQNFKNAPPIKAIGNDEFKRLIYEDNSGEKVDKRRKIDDIDASKILVKYFRSDRLTELLNNIIVKHYKTQMPEDQSMWTSDTSRLTYVISDAMRGASMWMTDKSGVKVNEYVIKPMLDHVDRMMIKYIGSMNEQIDKENTKGKLDELADELNNATNIRMKVRNTSTSRELLRSSAPYFYLIR
jgi:hypothetical protein